MIFPANPLSDSDAYISLAHQCINSGICYDSIRPIGIIYYYSFLAYLFPDFVRLSYVVLFLNLNYIFGIFWILNSFFNPKKGQAISIFIFMIVSTNLVCLLPVSMSDLISMFVFFIGVFIIFAKVDLDHPNKFNYKYILLSGLLFAIAGLFKQNYVVYGFIYSGLVLALNLKTFLKHRINLCISILCFSLGMSMILIQFWVVNHYFHEFWLYSKVTMAIGKKYSMQPYIEAFGYTKILNSGLDESPGFYFTQLNEHVNQIYFILYKIFNGISHIDLMIYHGDRTNGTNIIQLRFLDNIKVVSVALMFGSYIIYFKKILSSKLYALLLMGLIVCFLYGHVENRYYIVSRLVFICVLIPLAVRFKNRTS